MAIMHPQPTRKKRPDITRRSVIRRLAGIAGLAAAGLSRGTAAEWKAPEQPVPPDPTKVLGRGGSPYGYRSHFENQVVRERFSKIIVPTNESTATLTPLHDHRGIITPSSLHFERHHAGIPTIDPSKHWLYIFGLVDRPVKLTMRDLLRYPSVSRILFTECSGNSLFEWSKGVKRWPSGQDNVQQTHGLLSGAEWTGVLLSTLLREAGVKREAKWIVAEGADAARMNRSVPLEKAWDDAIVAYGQNGEAIRPEQGYPMRLVLPGWEGNANIKWLHVIKVTDKPYQTREETSKYTDLMRDGTALQFTFVMEAKSVITYPSAQFPIPRSGFVEIRGLAWSGLGRIARVEVSTDGGKTWSLAELQNPVLPKALTLFRFPFWWDGREAFLQSRCTDETGYMQPTHEALIKARGLAGPLGPIYHYNGVQTWRVAPDGSIDNVHVPAPSVGTLPSIVARCGCGSGPVRL